MDVLTVWLIDYHLCVIVLRDPIAVVLSVNNVTLYVLNVMPMDVLFALMAHCLHHDVNVNMGIIVMECNVCHVCRIA